MAQPQKSIIKRSKQRRTIIPNSQELSHISSISRPSQAYINANGRKYNSKRVSNPSSRNSPDLDNNKNNIFIEDQDSDEKSTSSSVESKRIKIINDGASDISSIQSPPPLDEYIESDEEVPPYRENLHKYLDLFSFDPRFVPVLRVNKALVSDNNILDVSIQHFKKFNLLPPDIDLWKIHHIDDMEYNDMLPTIIPSEPVHSSQQILVEHMQHIEETERDQYQSHSRSQIQNQNQNQISTTEIDDSDIQLACILSLIDINQERRRNYSGFRYQSPPS